MSVRDGKLWRPYRFEQRPFSKGPETMWIQPESRFSDIREILSRSWWIYYPKREQPLHMEFVYHSEIIDDQMQIMNLNYDTNDTNHRNHRNDTDDIIYVFLDLPPECYRWSQNCVTVREKAVTWGHVEDIGANLVEANGFVEGAVNGVEMNSVDRDRSNLGFLRRQLLKGRGKEDKRAKYGDFVVVSQIYRRSRGFSEGFLEGIRDNPEKFVESVCLSPHDFAPREVAEIVKFVLNQPLS